jgi:hypothetical protein
VHEGAGAFGFAFGVEGAGELECFRVEREDGVQLRSGLVVGGDALEVDLDDFFGREAVVVGFLEIEDGRGRKVDFRCAEFDLSDQ